MIIVFSNLRLINVFLLAVAIFILSGCASTPKSDSEKDTNEEITESQKSGDEQLEEPFVLIPSPYAANKGNVPGQAKEEFSRVKVAIANKQWDKAQELLELMIATFPKLSGPYVNLGIVHLRRQEFDEAEKALVFAIETNQYNFDAYDLLGQVLREQGKFEDAEKYYLKALELWPHHFASNKNIGILYDLYMGRFEDALKYYELAQKIAGGEDKELKGWIIDLKRRMAN